MKNAVVVISNDRFEKGLISFINSYRKTKMKTPLIIIDTGLKNEYPYQTIKKNPDVFKLDKASWMKDASPYFQCELGDIDVDNIMYMEVDMLLLKNIDHLFNHINEKCVIAIMDDAALATVKHKRYIDSAGRYFKKMDFNMGLRAILSREKGFNGGLVLGTKSFYKDLQEKYRDYIEHYSHQYRLLAQSLLNQFFYNEHIFVKDMGLEYNFSGINEYYNEPERYKIEKFCNGYSVLFDKKIDISVLHFTGKDKPFLNDDKNIMRPVWEYYYNKGELIND